MDLAEMRGYANYPLMRFDRDLCHSLYAAWRTFWDRLLWDIPEDEKKSVMVCFDYFGGKIADGVGIAYDGKTWTDRDTDLARKLVGLVKADLLRTTSECNCDIYEHERNLEEALGIITHAKGEYEKRQMGGSEQ